MIRTRRAKMLYKLLWLIANDWGPDFIANVWWTVDIFAATLAKNVNRELIGQQLKKDYNNLMKNGITDKMFSN